MYVCVRASVRIIIFFFRKIKIIIYCSNYKFQVALEIIRERTHTHTHTLTVHNYNNNYLTVSVWVFLSVQYAASTPYTL